MRPAPTVVRDSRGSGDLASFQLDLHPLLHNTYRSSQLPLFPFFPSRKIKGTVHFIDSKKRKRTAFDSSERMVVDRLWLYLEKMDHISERQAGFRSNRGTTQQVISFSQEVKDGFHLKQNTLALFVDFKSAFDRIWRHVTQKVTKSKRYWLLL
ncbi:putative RNA-directed DNA polymerase from transposon BS [Caerostris darwini]|uniref:RNA-directed DNA polymerase from transposon BS n=1 Tax=Caerostris darwini TaxID=1538125 RepID=A0AAV4PTX6_9ARAC|nr:putative RNA-directed DNA polymerase from transposon BS [Caerostris darwini]